MGNFISGVGVGAIIGMVLIFVVVNLIDPHKKGMIAVASGQYSCELEERADKTTKWVCERAK